MFIMALLSLSMSFDAFSISKGEGYRRLVCDTNATQKRQIV